MTDSTVLFMIFITRMRLIILISTDFACPVLAYVPGSTSANLPTLTKVYFISFTSITLT